MIYSLGPCALPCDAQETPRRKTFILSISLEFDVQMGPRLTKGTLQYAALC